MTSLTPEGFPLATSAFKPRQYSSLGSSSLARRHPRRHVTRCRRRSQPEPFQVHCGGWYRPPRIIYTPLKPETLSCYLRPSRETRLVQHETDIGLVLMYSSSQSVFMEVVNMSWLGHGACWRFVAASMVQTCTPVTRMWMFPQFKTTS